MPTIRNPKDLIAAAAVFAVGLFWVVHGLSYPMGTMVRMGSGFFPVVLGVTILVLAVFLLLQALAVDDRLEPILWRPFAAVSASIAAFGLALAWLGMGPAILATVVISSLADRASRPMGTIILAIGLMIAIWLVFILGLGMTIPLFRNPF
jgi:hypothetical protein